MPSHVTGYPHKPIVSFAPKRREIQDFFFLVGALCLLVAEDIRVTGIEDGQGTASVHLSEGSAELNLEDKTSKHLDPPKSVKDFFYGHVAR